MLCLIIIILLFIMCALSDIHTNYFLFPFLIVSIFALKISLHFITPWLQKRQHIIASYNYYLSVAMFDPCRAKLTHGNIKKNCHINNKN